MPRPLPARPLPDLAIAGVRHGTTGTAYTTLSDGAIVKSRAPSTTGAAYTCLAASCRRTPNTCRHVHVVATREAHALAGLEPAGSGGRP